MLHSRFCLYVTKPIITTDSRVSICNIPAGENKEQFLLPTEKGDLPFGFLFAVWHCSTAFPLTEAANRGILSKCKRFAFRKREYREKRGDVLIKSVSVERVVCTMKYKTAVVAVSLALASVVLIGAARGLSERTEQQKKQVVASFYPVYIAALNITDGAEDIEVVNLTQSQTGCLHDFTLRPQDMITLEGASLFLTNGAGMESFLDDVVQSLPSLPVTDSSTGISLLHTESCMELGHDHEHEHDHDEEEHNAHIWMSLQRYEQQVQNLCSGLSAQFPQEKALFEENAKAYIEKIESLRTEMAETLAPASGMRVILFHDSFAYFADEFGMEIVATIPVEADTALNAGEIAQIVSEIKSTGIRILFAEEQYSTELAEAIARETDAKVYLLDTAVSGDDSLDAYLKAMRRNMETVQQALAEAKE